MLSMNFNRITLLIWLFCSQVNTAIGEELSTNQRREAAVIEARKGNFATAIPELSNLAAKFLTDISIQTDYIVALVWANKDQEALNQANAVDIQAMPTYGIAALAKAARNVGQTERSLEFYGFLQKREPESLDFQLGEILTRIDAKDFDVAESLLVSLREKHPQVAGIYRTLSYLGMQSKQPVIVIDANMHLITLNKQDIDASRALISAAGALGAYPQALQFSYEFPQAADKSRIDFVHNDNAAHHIAWGRLTTLNPEDRFVDTDKALFRLDALCQSNWNALDLSATKNQNLVFDRMVALRDRYRMDEVITHHKQLTDANIKLPDYVLNAAGDAYLYKRMPEDALQAYEASLRLTPNNIETKFAKFHALIELEDFDPATHLIDDIAQTLNPLRNRPNNAVIRPQEYKLDADIKTFYARAFGDDLQYAEQRLSALNEVGPMNTDVKLSQGEIWRWRGWPERTENHFNELSKDFPTLLFPKIQLAHAHLDLRDWRIAESEVKALENVYPENLLVQEIGKRWMLHNERQLIVEINSTEASGGTFGSRTHGLNAALYSRPFSDHYRTFVSTQFDKASFPEGDGHASFPNIGLEYTDRDWRLTGAVGQSNSSESRLTTTLTAEYRLDDYWSFSSLLDMNSREMPLRGLRNHVSGHLAEVSGTHRWSDLMSASASFAYMDMDDGNQRKLASLLFDHRLMTKPHYKLAAHLRANASDNTENNTLYFNPERDLDITATLDNAWMLWRRYERSFTHRLQLGVGGYWQKNFGSNNTWTASYEHQWHWDDRIELDYGVMRYMHPYDGTDEYFTQLFARLNLLF